jgi:hypothetical protein
MASDPTPSNGDNRLETANLTIRRLIQNLIRHGSHTKKCLSLKGGLCDCGWADVSQLILEYMRDC